MMLRFKVGTCIVVERPRRKCKTKVVLPATKQTISVSKVNPIDEVQSDVENEESTTTSCVIQVGEKKTSEEKENRHVLSVYLI